MSVTINEIIDIFERSNKEALESKGGVAGFAKNFETDLKSGLGQAEATNGYAERKEKYGINELPDPPSKSWCLMFLETFKDLMLQILLVCAVLSLILTIAFPEGGDRSEFTQYIETISIFVAVLIVSMVQATIDFSQQKSFMEINKLKNVYNINVIRNGEEEQILSTELLVGDILALKNGDKVAADALYIDGHNLKINNSQETGESVAVQISDDFPFILGGGAVESGDAHALVCAVGPNSQSGVTMMKIQEIEEEAEQSPLEKKLDYIAKLLTYMGLAGALLTFIVLLIFWIIDVAHGWHKEYVNKLIKHFMTGVTIFICAVPEGLPLAVTISLGFSMKKMMKDNNFVRHLNACETMGGATTICSDKTGTLTQNKMSVVRFYMIDRLQTTGKPEIIPDILSLFTEGIALNSTAYFTVKEGETTGSYVGPSSECALLQMLPEYDIQYKDIRDKYPAVYINEFNSARKRMSVVINKDGMHRVYAKGAPDFVLRLSSKYMDEQGQIQDLTDEIRAKYLDAVSKMADDSLRTMLLAYRDLGETLDENWQNAEVVEDQLTVIAIVGIADPLRPEVKKAVADCHRAGVVVRMVTGDYINTARAIARECGILEEGDIAIEGAEFAKKSKTDLIDLVPKLRVMARSSPRDKYRLVSYLMEAGEVVAVTGDGSNDSAALKKANVGLSMGMCGTELAKMASDIIILDDNFNSIVNALKWGRCVYDNVRGFLQFQLTVNFAAMFVAFIGSVALHESPLTTIQLLWVNLIMDSLGALALATRGPLDSLLNRQPYGESDGLISNVLARNIAGHTVYQMIVLLLILFLPDDCFKIYDPQTRATVVFNTFIYMQVFNLINARVAGQDMSVLDGLFTNPYFLGIFFGIGAFQVVIIEAAGAAFDVVPLNWRHWLVSLGFGLGSIPVGIILRLIRMPDKTTEKLNALRETRKQEMLQRYNGKSAEEQWNYDPEAEKKTGEVVEETKS